MENIPIFDVVIDEEETSGTNIVSFVSDPAIGVNWFAFNQDHTYLKMASEEERKVFGALLIPNQTILRKSAVGEPFFVRFSQEAIEKTRDKFMLSNGGSRANMEHTPMLMEGVYMVESFIKGSAGIQPPSQYAKLPDGTWFATFKVDNEEVWNKYIKEGVFTGFSIEGEYGLMETGEAAGLDSDMKFSRQVLESYIKVLEEQILTS